MDIERIPVRAHAHGVTHTRPIVARGVHFNAANLPFGLEHHRGPRRARSWLVFLAGLALGVLAGRWL